MLVALALSLVFATLSWFIGGGLQRISRGEHHEEKS